MGCCAIKSISAGVLFSDSGMTFALFAADFEAGISDWGSCPALDRRDHHLSRAPLVPTQTWTLEGVLNILLYESQIKTPVYLRKTPCPTTRPWIDTLIRNQDSIPSMHP